MFIGLAQSINQGTTGCLALAVTQRSAQEMSRQFAKGTVHKTYLALIRGDRKTLPGLSGVVKDPIRYDDGYFDGFGEDGSPSITHWKLLGDSVGLSSLFRLPISHDFLSAYCSSLPRRVEIVDWKQTSVADTSI